MKTKKSQAVLFMLETLIRNESFTKKEIMEALELNNLSFERYISEIRCYFANFEPSEELIYQKKANTYRLIQIRL
jgi:hypothetical protein